MTAGKAKLKYYYEVVFLDGSKMRRENVTKTFAVSVYNKYMKAMVVSNVKRVAWGEHP
jgi:hypothetical protein